ncbi:hypothetical protein B0A48_18813 [Cryoendolithus antarcticus]|uniref:Uncharacterized protein n=1 Tax=Cryoendolithus antarcticus TaxID=1507870 RepID=A0A1V8S7M8_9PEZI|nr:hypothetical protein B0A48_18813 [Cryoendolithus antarcticus]
MRIPIHDLSSLGYGIFKQLLVPEHRMFIHKDQSIRITKHSLQRTGEDGMLTGNLDFYEPKFGGIDNNCKKAGLNIAFRGNTDCFNPLGAAEVSLESVSEDNQFCNSDGYGGATGALMWFNLGKNLC